MKPLNNLFNSCSRFSIALAIAAGMLSANIHAENAVSNPSEKGHIGSVDSLTQGLRQRLESNPDDLEGWILLAKSYNYMQQWDEAKFAYEKAKELGYDGPPLQPNSNMPMQGNPHANHAKRENVSSIITNGVMDAINKNNASANSPNGIPVSVSISSELKNSLDPNSRVFIFVRAVGENGPPLAAVRKMVSDLPVTLVMNDTMAMMPGRNISSVDKVTIVARISMSGSAAQSKQDIEVSSDTLNSDHSEKVELTLSQN
ncbi:hypothetical protein [Teredinibacter sp. KSP-S5-2]|uniref:tetratricopeptide repeat protein n=1 Tax=Teredinibacter sp. KSP-S5-2 TaxID=3034506 RepID=UPI0029351845|nr:hypothetical protein [Teredinibacter sp. KSP-S5-2]WNO11446.1 hypothetical protein P5V12_09710 [Teredinibacter sp. KSP-S5-2]